MFNYLKLNVMKKEMYVAPTSELFNVQTEQIICQSSNYGDEEPGD